jgi:hypothetical protein
VSQATVSRYMPPSRKNRRSQAWRTFIRHQAITIVQSGGLNGYHWTRDLLSQVRSRSRAFSYHLSAFVVAPVTGPSCWVVWRTLNPLLLAVARPRVRFTRIAILTTKSTALAYRHTPAARKAGGPLINALNLQAHAFYAFDATVPRPRQIACIPKLQLAGIELPSQTSSLPHPFGTTFSTLLFMRLTF